MKLRRFWAAVLALSMALGLAACGGEGAGAPTPPAEVTAEATARPTVAPTAAVEATAAPTPEPTVEATAQPSAQPVELREYTLTEIDLPEGWSPTGDFNNVAAGWVFIERIENGAFERAVYLAADGAIRSLDGYFTYSPGPARRGDETQFLMYQQDGSLHNVFDIEQGRFLLDEPASWEEVDALLNKTWPQPREDEATGLWGYVDKNGDWVIPAQYNRASPFQDGVAVVALPLDLLDPKEIAIDVTGKELLPRQYLGLFYLGDGMFNYWGENGENDCGLVSIDGVETPTETFKYYFNGGLTANYGLVAMTIYGSETYDDAYFDYAGNQVSEAFDWAGPIGDDGAGFVCKDGKLYRIQF